MPLSHLFRLLAAPLVVATTLLVGQTATTAWQARQQADLSLRAVDDLRLALQVAEQVSRERGPTNGVLGDEVPAQPQRLQALREARARTDAAFDAAQPVLRADAQDGAASQLDAARTALAHARAEVDTTLARPKAQRSPAAIGDVVRGMVAVVPLLAPVVGQLANDAQQAYPALGDQVQGARLAAELREFAGQLGSHFTAALARQQPFTVAERLAIEHTRGRIDELQFLLQLHVQVPGQAEPVLQAWQTVGAHYFGGASALVERVIAAGDSDGRYGLDAAGFAALYVPDMNTIFALRDQLLDRARGHALAERARSTQVLAAVATGSALLLAALLTTLLVVHNRILRPLAATRQALHDLTLDGGHVTLQATPANDEISAVVGAVRTLQTQTQQRQALELERDGLIDRLREQSNTDFLTGLPNRRAFFDAAEAELARARRHGFGAVAILLDIDHFKQFNDRHGHAGGDLALTAVAQTIRRSLRQGDLAARFGGEEFVLLLGHCDGAQGLRFAERLREMIAEVPVPCPAGDVVQVSASLGVAASEDHGLVLELLLSHADKAMYRAKRGGRNRVAAAEITDLLLPADADTA